MGRMIYRREAQAVAFLLVSGCFAGWLSGFPAEDGFQTIVQPFLKKNCYLCHNAQARTANLNLEAYTDASSVQKDKLRWERVIRKLETGEMPPAQLSPPDHSELEAVIRWLKSELPPADRPVEPPSPGRVTAHRLNRSEYDNTIRDLLGIDLRPAADFPPDDSGYGFDVIADVLSLPPVLLEMYVGAAEKVVHSALFGPGPIKPTAATFEDVRTRGDNNWSLADYDETGLTLPGAIHVTCPFPADGEYEFSMLPVGNRPAGSEPLDMGVWLDGRLIKTLTVRPVHDAAGFPETYREGQQFRHPVHAGEHWVAVTYLREFEGLPARFHGKNPSPLPAPPPPDSTVIQPPPALTPEQAADFRRRVQEGLRDGNAKVSTLTANLTISGPFDANTGPPEEALRKILGCASPGCVTDISVVRGILRRFMRGAFRRPVSDEELDRYARLATAAREQGNSLMESLAVALEAVLVSPQFLFRLETPGAPGVPGLITQNELASRLSYFLWSSMPDNELMDCADRGALRSPEVLEAQVRRMLRDPKSRALAENFGGQWLETRKLESAEPNQARFPQFDPYLRMSMQRETELFFEDVVREDRSIFEFIDAQYAFINERLAQHYGLHGVKGPEFRKVDLSGTPRRGVLGQGGVLTVTAYATRTSPVIRGKWILSNLLNRPPPPPPPNVPPLEQSTAGKAATVRQQLEKHRENPACASCHATMDPFGFALENYDAVGGWRTEDGTAPIDATGELPNGRRIDGLAGLSAMLDADRGVFADCLTRKMLTYALGRGLEPDDKAAVDGIVSRLEKNRYSFSTLVLEIVRSAPFQMRQDSGGQ